MLPQGTGADQVRFRRGRWLCGLCYGIPTEKINIWSKKCPYCGQFPAQRKMPSTIIPNGPYDQKRPAHENWRETHCCSDHFTPNLENSALRYSGIPYEDPAETARA